MSWDFNYLWTSNKKFCWYRYDVIEFFVHIISIEILFMVDFVHSIITTTKIPMTVLAWESLQKGFVMLVVVVFYLTGSFSYHYFSTSFHFYRECYGFEWAFYTQGRFLPYTPLFVTQMTAGTPLPGSSSVPALTELSLPADAWTWTIDVWITRPLIYQLRQWATKYGVKLLNIFCLFKVMCKDC